jgi:hypothetical protein
LLIVANQALRPLAHRGHEIADGGTIERVDQLVGIACIDGPRCEILELFVMPGALDPVPLQQSREIANAVRVLELDLIDGEDSLEALLDRLLDMEAECIVGDIGVVEQLARIASSLVALR